MDKKLFAVALGLLAEHPKTSQLGPVHRVTTIRTFKNLHALCEAPDEVLDGMGRAVTAGRSARETLQTVGVDVFETAAARLIEAHLEAGISIAAIDDGEYPDVLALAPDAPPVIYWRGRLEPISIASAAIVGTRQPTEKGCSIAERLSAHLASKGVAIISGLALGIDTVAHVAALRAGGYTAAVLAQPLDQVAPASNRQLAFDIVESGGALIGEHPIGKVTDRYEFARRDRIQSGLSRIVIPIQTGEEGGTQNTIKAAKSQRRQIWAPRTDNEGGHEKWKGIEALLSTGAARGFTSADYEEMVTSSKAQFSLWQT
jgi:DNA protecting protein DprA